MIECNGMKKPITIITLIVLIVLVGAVLFIYQSERQAKNEGGVTVKKTESAAAPSGDSTVSSNGTYDTSKLIIGDPKAPVTIVEYADYKCPECNKFYRSAGKEIRKQYVETGKANIEFRPFPLFGEDSGLALYASFCAAEQGKFSAYHDKMFDYMWDTYYNQGDYSAETQKLFSPASLAKLAASVGMDEGKFATCAGGSVHAAAYHAAANKAAGDSVQGTPTVLIAGKKVVGPQPFGVYKTLLDIAGQ